MELQIPPRHAQKGASPKGSRVGSPALGTVRKECSEVIYTAWEEHPFTNPPEGICQTGRELGGAPFTALSLLFDHMAGS